MAAGPVLRALTAADAEELAAAYAANRDFLAPFEPVRPDAFYTAVGQRARLAEPRADAWRFAIVDGRGTIVGGLSISNVVRAAFRSANLGYWVARSHNGRGLATAAVAEAVELAFGEGELHRLEAGTLVDNLASQRVLEKNGFERIGLAPRYLHIAGAWRDHILFQRVADDV